MTRSVNRSAPSLFHLQVHLLPAHLPATLRGKAAPRPVWRSMPIRARSYRSSWERLEGIRASRMPGELPPSCLQTPRAALAQPPPPSYPRLPMPYSLSRRVIPVSMLPFPHIPLLPDSLRPRRGLSSRSTEVWALGPSAPLVTGLQRAQPRQCSCRVRFTYNRHP